MLTINNYYDIMSLNMSDLEKNESISLKHDRLTDLINYRNRNEGRVNAYAETHRCSWDEAISALHVMDPDDLSAYGLKIGEDGYSMVLALDPTGYLTEDTEGVDEQFEKQFGIPNDDDEKKYVSKDTSVTFSFNELVKLSEGCGIPIKKYCEMNGIDLIESVEHQMTDIFYYKMDLLETAQPGLNKSEIDSLSAAVDIAGFVASSSGSDVYMQDVRDKVLKFIRLGSEHENPKPNAQELDMIQEFENRFCGANNALSRHEIVKKIKEYREYLDKK